jgi:hypothetical protein
MKPTRKILLLEFSTNTSGVRDYRYLFCRRNKKSPRRLGLEVPAAGVISDG